MPLTGQIVKDIIKKLLKGKDYRTEIVTLINSEFLQFTIDFFKQVVDIKLKNKNINVDWYKNAFLHHELSKEEIAINAGLNIKTISNMFNSTKKEIVIEASNEHYKTLYDSIKALVDTEHDIDLTLTIKFKGVSIDLNVSESLIVINTLAVKRASLRGGLWSTAGKRVEKPLMQTLCELYSVPKKYYKSVSTGNNIGDIFEREIDFYLQKDKQEFKCEVKLMGKGNPESADAVIARDSKVLIADKLSDTNKTQLDSLGIEWVELRNDFGFRKFKTVLETLEIPHSNFDERSLDKKINNIFQKIFH